MSSDERRSPQDRPFAFSGIGTFPKFNCYRCGGWFGTLGRRKLKVPGVIDSQWHCPACVKERAK